jgi:ribonuclease BN (tRNA processing enzyme)
VYISDHQAPSNWESGIVSDSVIELCKDCDLLIHDAQYTRDEFDQKTDWGHCTYNYALMVAKASNAKALALFHHDPYHSDEQIDQILSSVIDQNHGKINKIYAAFEGMTVDLRQHSTILTTSP